MSNPNSYGPPFTLRDLFAAHLAGKGGGWHKEAYELADYLIAQRGGDTPITLDVVAMLVGDDEEDPEIIGEALNWSGGKN